MSNPYEIKIGSVYAFVRKGHEWSGCEVAILAPTPKGFRVARSASVCEALMAKTNSKKRKLKTWVAQESELV